MEITKFEATKLMQEARDKIIGILYDYKKLPKKARTELANIKIDLREFQFKYLPVMKDD